MTRALLVALALLLAVVAGCGGGEEAPEPPARSAAARFLDDFVAADGRVVRHDQGGDTVSEGQAYALLVTAATGDERRFDRVWRWTRRALQRDDGLLSWQWKDGRVVDPQPAADADLDAADALLRAAERFDRPELAREARRIGAAVERSEVRDGVVVAGPWARDQGVVNPSYVAPSALRALGLGDVGTRSAVALRGLLAGGLPPDWARLRDDGTLEAASPPNAGDPPRYGYEAVRLPLRLASACAGPWRELAAGMHERLGDGRLPRGLDGTPQGEETAPGLAAAAAAAYAAGDAGTGEDLLAHANAREEEHPTYFGSALIALAETAWSPDC